jgi:hypothetical protein
MSSHNTPPAIHDHRRSLPGRDHDTRPRRGARRRRLIAACVAATTVLTGCTTAGASDPLQATAHLVVATPAASPKPSRTAAGTVLSAPAANLAAFDPTTRTVVLAGGATLSLFDARAPQTPPRTVTLPAAPTGLHTAPDGTVLAAIPTKNLVARVNLRTGTTTAIPVTGGPSDAVDLGGPLAVALHDTHDVAIVDHGVVTRGTGGNFQDPAQLLTPGGTLLAVDRLTTSVTQLDQHTAAAGDALRAGDGATNGVTDRYGRALVVDTRGSALLAFSTGPLMLKQLYPVPGAPYAIAYDPTRDLAWVSLTATNEVVGYDVAGGEPVERYRLPTVRQPDALAVDPVSGQVFIASAAGEGLQVVKV